MKVISATYGDKNVEDIVSKHIKNNVLNLRVSNDLFGDPNYGTVKRFNLELELNGSIEKYTCLEGESITIPKFDKERLGIFCSNNINPKIYPTIKKCLNVLNTNAENIDVITCMWQEEVDNPFLDIKSIVKNTPGNINHQIQILQCLNFAKDQHYHKYKYVSFLEHDVLYSESHFQYSDFSEDYIVNDNYIGLNTNGFQKKQNQKHRPLSQITMNFDFAIKYFSHNLGLALSRGHASVEPHWEPKYDSTFKIIENIYSNVHINHGHSFTSHYQCFSNDYIETVDEYWGDHEQYKYLFKGESNG